MQSFVDRYAGNAKSGAPLKFLYLQLYDDLFDTAVIYCRNPQSGRDAVNQCIGDALKKLITPELQKNVGQSLALFATTDISLFTRNFLPVMMSMAERPGAEAVFVPLMHKAADATHSSIEMVENNPGHN